MTLFAELNFLARSAYIAMAGVLVAVTIMIVVNPLQQIYNFFRNPRGEPGPSPPWYELIDEHAVESDEEDEGSWLLS
ncbi:uncharacterized protein TRIVIDRAFT_223577 [Trichoderma virens Gv29-8]|uniref:Uncharacterized protein n=1 Tax=Hypocrea virens (strain Gv29-8 / FGSC 10586) TaxID=413071 RepID=G9MXI6_HYPVG|nr:uncharacterized protein TRIVIDRAFT_223577 [Trichoderma virens Gv29-8]EHK20884.1 hypothetical protein TRIVIDRAFT_223577 [Trichoderma virens Gv29-8]UKZ56848.1 hypothetical protein TrVGV298_010692 [Trichoderma virens]